MNRTLLVLACLASPAAASAATWQPNAELGIVNTTGNSETTSINGRFGLKAEEDLWLHDYYLAALRSESDGELTANRYELGAKSDRMLTERSYLGAAGRYENDDFSPYAYQATLALNYGGWLLREEGQSFKIEGGPGIRRAERADTGDVESGALLRGFADYQHQITDSTKFFNTTLVEATSDNTFAQNDIGIAVSINKTLALKVAFQARHNTDVPVGTERTDTLSSVNIVWSPAAD
ncbi:DUF481 domain-containing protein [Arenimonas aestuarii]